MKSIKELTKEQREILHLRIAVATLVVGIIGILVAIYINKQPPSAQGQHVENEEKSIVLPEILKEDYPLQEVCEIMTDEERKKEIREALKIIKQEGFNITLYELQIERESNIDACMRELETLCSNYIQKEAHTQIKIVKDTIGQTSYAFITNRDMWITDASGGFLNKKKNSNVKYVDGLSRTEQIEDIPDFWVMGSLDEDIKTSVIYQLRCPSLDNKPYSNFGLINFCSTEYVPLMYQRSNERKGMERLKKAFMKITELFALDYMEQKVNEYKQKHSRNEKTS